MIKRCKISKNDGKEVLNEFYIELTVIRLGGNIIFKYR